MHACTYVRTCVYVCMYSYVCMHVCMYVNKYKCIYVHVFMYVCIYVCPSVPVLFRSFVRSIVRPSDCMFVRLSFQPSNYLFLNRPV